MPLPPRTLAALLAVADRLDRVGVVWLLTGGAARALQGAAHRPADIDLEVDGPDAPAAAAALGLALVDAEDATARSLRAQGTIAGCGVDLTTRLTVSGAGARLDPDWAMQLRWATPVVVAGRRVLAAPTEETLARALVRGDWTRVAKVAAGGGSPPRVAYLAERLASISESAVR